MSSKRFEIVFSIPSFSSTRGASACSLDIVDGRVETEIGFVLNPPVADFMSRRNTDRHPPVTKHAPVAAMAQSRPPLPERWRSSRAGPAAYNKYNHQNWKSFN